MRCEFLKLAACIAFMEMGFIIQILFAKLKENSLKQTFYCEKNTFFRYEIIKLCFKNCNFVKMCVRNSLAIKESLF